MGARKGSGTVYVHKASHRYVAELYLGEDEQGKRKVWRFYAPDDSPESYDLAKSQLARAIVERGRGVNLVPERQTVAEYLDFWLGSVVKPGAKPRTYESYEAMIRLHLVPALGSTPLLKLGPPQIHQCLSAMGKTRNAELGYAVLHAAVEQAVEWGVLAANVVDRVKRPRYKAPEKVPFGPDEAARFLAAIRGDRLEALWIATLALGLRRGEVTGLRWADVRLDRGTVSLAVQLQRLAGAYQLVPLKTQRSRRTLPLPSFVAESLGDHRARQLLESSQHPWGLVFTTREGQPLNGPALSHRFKEMVAAAGLPDLDLHDLRHTAGSLLAATGTSAPVIRDLLGHSQLSTTDVYLHSIPAEHRAALDRLSAVLLGLRGSYGDSAHSPPL